MNARKTAENSSRCQRTPATLDGLNVSGMFLDELHAIKDRNMYDVLKGGTYSRSQPLTVIMSTGGYYERDSLFDTKYSEYMSIIDGYSTGRYVDESTLPIIYELDSKEEVVDPSNWIKANPNLGVSKNPERLEREFNRATLDEKTMRDLLVKQFNFRETPGIPSSTWKTLKTKRLSIWMISQVCISSAASTCLRPLTSHVRPLPFP